MSKDGYNRFGGVAYGDKGYGNETDFKSAFD